MLPELPAWVKRLGPVAIRLAIGHFASYPPALVWTVAVMAPVIFSFTPAELAILSEQDAARKITYRSLELGGIVFLLVHLFSIPWAVAKTDPSAKKRQKGFFVSVIALLFLGFVVAAVGWGYIVFFMK